MLLWHNNRYQVRERFESSLLDDKSDFTKFSLLLSVKFENLPWNGIMFTNKSNKLVEVSTNWHQPVNTRYSPPKFGKLVRSKRNNNFIDYPSLKMISFIPESFCYHNYHRISSQASMIVSSETHAQ